MNSIASCTVQVLCPVPGLWESKWPEPGLPGLWLPPLFTGRKGIFSVSADLIQWKESVLKKKKVLEFYVVIKGGMCEQFYAASAHLRQVLNKSYFLGRYI